MAVRPLGLITREAPVERLTWCVRRVAAGRSVVDPDLARTARAIDENPLTRRRAGDPPDRRRRRLDGRDRRGVIGERQDGAQPSVPYVRPDRRPQPDGRDPHRERARMAVIHRWPVGGGAARAGPHPLRAGRGPLGRILRRPAAPGGGAERLQQVGDRLELLVQQQEGSPGSARPVPCHGVLQVARRMDAVRPGGRPAALRRSAASSRPSRRPRRSSSS